MARLTMYCPVCNTEISLPDDITRLNCSNCQSSLILETGDGYMALRLDDKDKTKNSVSHEESQKADADQQVAQKPDERNQTTKSNSDPILVQLEQLWAEQATLETGQQTKEVKQRLNAIHANERYLLEQAPRYKSLQPQTHSFSNKSVRKGVSKKKTNTLLAIIAIIFLCICLPLAIALRSFETSTPTPIAASNKTISCSKSGVKRF